MRRRWKYGLVFASAFVVLLGLLVSGVFRSREPEYEGKKLSEWVEMYPSFGLPGDADLAARGVRAIGSNGIPFLLKWLEYEPSPLRQKFFAAINDAAKRLGLSYRHYDVREWRRATGAAEGLLVIGPPAYPTVKELARVMHATNTTISATHAYRVLNAWVFESKDWRLAPVLKEMLNDPNQKMREFAAHGLRVIGSPVQESKPAQSARPAR